MRSQSVSSPEQMTRFEAWYSLYPRKEARAMAEKAWLRLAPDDELARRITDVLCKQIAAGLWSERKFVPLPASWLNGRRWEDDLLVEAPRGRQGSRPQPPVIQKDVKVEPPMSPAERREVADWLEDQAVLRAEAGKVDVWARYFAELAARFRENAMLSEDGQAIKPLPRLSALMPGLAEEKRVR